MKRVEPGFLENSQNPSESYLISMPEPSNLIMKRDSRFLDNFQNLSDSSSSLISLPEPSNLMMKREKLFGVEECNSDLLGITKFQNAIHKDQEQKENVNFCNQLDWRYSSIKAFRDQPIGVLIPSKSDDSKTFQNKVMKQLADALEKQTSLHDLEAKQLGWKSTWSRKALGAEIGQSNSQRRSKRPQFHLGSQSQRKGIKEATNSSSPTSSRSDSESNEVPICDSITKFYSLHNRWYPLNMLVAHRWRKEPPEVECALVEYPEVTKTFSINWRCCVMIGFDPRGGHILLTEGEQIFFYYRMPTDKRIYLPDVPNYNLRALNGWRGCCGGHSSPVNAPSSTFIIGDAHHIKEKHVRFYVFEHKWEWGYWKTFWLTYKEERRGIVGPLSINDHILWVTYGNGLEVLLPDRETVLQIKYDVLNAANSHLGILKHGEDIVFFRRSINGEGAELYVISFQKLLNGEELEERFETAAGFNFFFVNGLEGASREVVNQEISGRIFSAERGKHHVKIFRCVDGVIVLSEELLFQCEVSCRHRFGWQFLR